MNRVKVKNSKNLYTKLALFALIALIGIFCGTLLFFNSFGDKNFESKKLYAATTVSTETELIDAINNGETDITLGANISVSSTVNLSNVTISGSSRTLTIASAGIINLGSNSTIDISSLSVSGILNIAYGTINNNVVVTNSGVCNIIGGTIDGDVTVNSTAQLNFAEPSSTEISITGTITLENSRYINIAYPIANSTNKFKVHVNGGADGDIVVKYDKAITDSQAVLSTFQLYNNSTFNLIKEQVGTGSDAYYALKLQANSAVVNYVAYNGSTSFSGGPNIEVRLNGTLVGTLTSSNRTVILGATSGSLTLTGNYIKLGSDFTANPTDPSIYATQSTTVSGSTAYSVYARDIYTITMDANGGSPDTTKYKVYGINQTVSYSTEPTKPHHEFSNWNTQPNGGGTSYANGATYTTNDDLIVYAQWNPGNSNYTVKHYVMDTTGSYPSASTYQNLPTPSGIYGTTINVSDLIRTQLLITNGIEFDHAEVDGVTVTQTTILEDDSRVINLYYRRLQHTLTLSCGLGISSVSNGGVITTSPISYYYDQTVSIDATLSSTDYAWDKWTGYQTKSQKSTTITIPAQDISLTANAVEEVLYNITITVNDSTYGTASPASFQARNNANITISGNRITVGNTQVTATPSQDTAEWDYSFDSWSGVPAGNKVNEPLIITANFTRVKQQYTVTWRNWDNSILDTDIVDYGDLASWGSRANPTRPDDDYYYDYVFQGWESPGVFLGLNNPIEQDTDFIAQFQGTPRKYLIIWQNWDGTELYRDSQVEYNTMPVYNGPTPTRTSAEFVYTWSGWSPEMEPATGAQTYTATYTTESRKYTITWLNWDLEPLMETQVAYGVVPQYPGETPTRPREQDYSYTFSGWYPEPVAVTTEATYVAQFSEAYNQYTVTINADPSEYGSVSSLSVSVDYDTVISVDDNVLTIGAYTITATPIQDTEQYDYVFVNWTGIPANNKVHGDMTITANFDREIQKYTVTWYNWNGGTPLETDENVFYGSLPSYNKSSNPTKAATAEYTYTFAGWALTEDSEIGTAANNLPEVHGDINYYAAFSKTKNKYTITWLNWDGTTLKSEQVEYGTVPQYSGSTPTRPAGQDNSYIFTGWSPVPVAVTGPAEYTAQYSSTTNQYIVTIEVNNGDYGSVDQVNVAVDYNTAISASGNVLTVGATPVTATETADTDEFDYSFVEWQNVPSGGKVIDHVTIRAVFERVTKTYTIIWKNEDNTVLETDNPVAYGSTPHYDGVTPTKASTDSVVYTFKGWSPTVSQVTGDATYTATYNSAPRKYTITWLNWDNSPLGEPTQADYNVIPNYPYATPTREGNAHHEYEFIGWTPALTNVTGDATYKATFEEVVYQYQITINFDKTKCITNPVLTISINDEDIDVVNDGSIERIFDYGTHMSISALVQGTYNMVWEEDGVSATKVSNLSLDEFVLQEDCDFILYISQIFNVSVDYDDSMGSVTQGASINAICGENVILTATALNGYKFVSWEKQNYFDAQDLSKPQATILNISSNCEIKANFEIMVYKIRIFIDGVQTEMEYNINSQEIALPTPSKEGFNFIGWTGSNGSKPEKNVTVQAGSFGDKVFYANFSKPEGNEKLIIIIAAASAVVVTAAVITIIAVSKKKRNRRPKRPITIDLSRFK